jgi:hypothetical protein
MSDDYLWDRSGTPEPDVKQLEDLLAPLRHDAPLRARPPHRRAYVAAGIAIAAAAAVVLWIAARPGTPAPGEQNVACGGDQGFRFIGQGGAVSCSGKQLSSGVLPIGGVLDTGPHRAELTIADIGQATLAPFTRVALERSGSDGHQLALVEGMMHARVSAPPRLFTVSTASARVVDLGCEYEIKIDKAGRGQIRVLLGLVELALPDGIVVTVPAGARAQIYPGRVPGLPYVETATPEVSSAIGAYQAGEADAVARILAAATASDAITLAELAMIDPAHRRSVLARLGELTLPPAGVTVEGAATDQKQLEAWVDAVVHGRVWKK